MAKAATIAARMRLLRGLCRPPMTSRELDRLTGLRQGHTAMIEKRESERVEARTLFFIARIFGVSMLWLFSGTGRDPKRDDVALPVLRARRAAHARDRPERRSA